MDAICFRAFTIHFGLKIRIENLECSNFGNVNRVVGFLNESDALLVEVVTRSAGQIYTHKSSHHHFFATDVGVWNVGIYLF